MIIEYKDIIHSPKVVVSRAMYELGHITLEDMAYMQREASEEFCIVEVGR